MKFLDGVHAFQMEAIFKKYYGSLCYYGSRYLDDAEVVQDLVQDIFVHLIESSQVFQTPEHLRNYLYLSVRNACLNNLHRNVLKERHIRYIQVNETSEDIPSEDILTAEVYRQLKEAVDELPDGCRKVLYLSYFEGRNNEQVAELLNLSVNTVRAQKMRGKLLLKNKLKHLLPLVLFFPDLFI